MADWRINGWRDKDRLLFSLRLEKLFKLKLKTPKTRFVSRFLDGLCKEVTKKMQVILGDYAHSLGLMFILLDFFQKS